MAEVAREGKKSETEEHLETQSASFNFFLPFAIKNEEENLLLSLTPNTVIPHVSMCLDYYLSPSIQYGAHGSRNCGS